MADKNNKFSPSEEKRIAREIEKFNKRKREVELQAEIENRLMDEERSKHTKC